MEVIKQLIRKGEELLASRRKQFNKEIIVNAEALENRVEKVYREALAALAVKQLAAAAPDDFAQGITDDDVPF